MADQYKRQVAKKLYINDALGGSFVKGQGNDVSYIVTGGGEISRVNIIATLVSMESPTSFVIDDGTGKITVRGFDDYIRDEFSLGDPLLILGKIREFSEERYIVPEIVRRVTDPRWIELRKKELGKKTDIQETASEPPQHTPKPETPVEEISEVDMGESLNRSDQIYDLIKKMDKGEGASTDEVISKSGDSDTEKIIMNLLKEGDIFEIAPGKLKVLE